MYVLKEIALNALISHFCCVPEMTMLEIDKALRKRALLRIANHPVVAKDVNEFRKKYPEWSTELNR